MSVALACAWRPRGEMARFQRLRPQLERVYESISITVPADLDQGELDTLRELPAVSVVLSPERGWGRYLAIQEALARSRGHIHYADMDRLLRWVETKPGEWEKTAATIQTTDCLIIGRTEGAMSTHPQAVQQTEQIISAVFSYLLRRPVDLGGGSRGFSRCGAQLLMANSQPGGAGDAEWPILLWRAGLAVDYVAVDGLEWEAADRYRDEAADQETQRRAALAYDADPARWAFRVDVAHEIIQEGLAAMQQALLES